VGPNWGAIWAGLFTFVGIWAVFGMLGEAIFASAANANSPNPVGNGIGWGMGIWAIVLTAIAMYVGGRVTSGLSRSETRHSALLQGQTMFGLAVVAATIIIVLGGSAISGGNGANTSATSAYGLSLLSGLGWVGFISLFVGWLAALGGAATGVPTSATRNTIPENVRDIRAA
jgi:Trk-type K+ transport system membrane component